MADEISGCEQRFGNLVALSTIPGGGSGSHRAQLPPDWPTYGGSLGFDFAFVRLLDPTGGPTIDVTKWVRHQGIFRLAADQFLL